MRTRLCAESLESRDCPDSYWWTGRWGATFDGRPAQPPEVNRINWAVGDAQGVLVESAINPPAGSDLYYDADVVRQFTREGFLPEFDSQWGNNARAFRSLHVFNGYPGTIQISPTALGFLDLQGGKIDQSAAAVITVTGRMFWIGGELDSSPASPSRVKLTGAGTVAEILPQNGWGTTPLKTADTIEAGAGTELRFGYGTVTFTGADGGLRLNGGIANIKADTRGKQLEFKKVTGSRAYIGIDAGGQYTVSQGMPGVNGVHITELPISVSGGTLTINRQVHVSVRDGFPVSGRPELRYGVQMLSGKINLATTSRIEMTRNANALVMSDGDFIIHVVLDGTDAVIDAPMSGMGVSGGTVSFTQALDCYGKLEVNGKVFWSGGTYKPLLRLLNGEAKSCFWRSTNTFTVTGGSLAVDTDAAIGQGQNLVGKEWTILQSADQIVGNPPAGPFHYLVLPPKVGDENKPRKEWILKRYEL